MKSSLHYWCHVDKSSTSFHFYLCVISPFTVGRSHETLDTDVKLLWLLTMLYPLIFMTCCVYAWFAYCVSIPTDTCSCFVSPSDIHFGKGREREGMWCLHTHCCVYFLLGYRDKQRLVCLSWLLNIHIITWTYTNVNGHAVNLILPYK